MWVGEGLKVEEIHGKGRGLVSSQPLKGGQVVLKDSPILLYSTRPLNPQQQVHSTSALYCDNCFRRIQPASAAIPCPSCSHNNNHHFCSTNCLSVAAASSHSPWVCQSLARLSNYPDLTVHQPLERQVQARYLVAAYNLAIVNPSQFQILMSLQSTHSGDDVASAKAAVFLHSLISTLCPPPTTAQGFAFTLELTSSLLARDKLNAFGLMENIRGERSVRAYGIYPRASLFNHDCLPNACRFDYVDSESGSNTDIIIRMIHDVPQGREICLSYFPVNESYSCRQKRLLEDYGFACDCDRCKVEANWSDSDQEENDGGETDQVEEMDEDQDEEMEAGEEDLHSGDDEAREDFPHAYFFLRYMCNVENCWGTMAPLPPSDGNSSNLLECNVCGNLKNDELLGAEC
ncbi:unnamed protein product [Linum tenue]|uniref:SET domain-containing protein n=1 Tax=Linum tenue TaxID=586396 RepID=A0AAV0NWF3_9ROSI|nr:unnamed protein product [Linum tenue]